eukprot:scaffold35515_cov90-Isochrysis_galbana.AAC.1
MACPTVLGVLPTNEYPGLSLRISSAKSTAVVTAETSASSSAYVHTHRSTLNPYASLTPEGRVSSLAPPPTPARADSSSPAPRSKFSSPSGPAEFSSPSRPAEFSSPSRPAEFSSPSGPAEFSSPSRPAAAVTAAAPSSLRPMLEAATASPTHSGPPKASTCARRRACSGFSAPAMPLATNAFAAALETMLVGEAASAAGAAPRTALRASRTFDNPPPAATCTDTNAYDTRCAASGTCAARSSPRKASAPCSTGGDSHLSSRCDVSERRHSSALGPLKPSPSASPSPSVSPSPSFWPSPTVSPSPPVSPSAPALEGPFHSERGRSHASFGTHAARRESGRQVSSSATRAGARLPQAESSSSSAGVACVIALRISSGDG